MKININNDLVKVTYSIDNLTLNDNFSNTTFKFFAIEYNDHVRIEMVAKANTGVNTTAFTGMISGLPTISIAQPVLVVNTISQDRGEVKCLYQTDGSIQLITNANKHYLAAGDCLFIAGTVMK